MTPKIDADLRKVSTRCVKPKCRTRDFVLHRHHKGHEFAFVKAFKSRHQQPRYRRFIERYFKYHSDDTVPICSKHHREIHFEYDKIIQQYKRTHGIDSLSECSWAMADKLMSQLRRFCDRWLMRETPGSDIPWPSNGVTKRKAVDAKLFLIEAELEDEEIPF